MTGEGTEPVARRIVTFSALAFVLGFTTVFVVLGATASTIGRLVASYREILAMLGGVAVIIMGLHFLGVFKVALLHREARIHVKSHPAGPVGAYIVGLAFAVGWTPCIGPVLGTVLFVAGAEQTVMRGAGLLAAYSLGLGLPFLAAALFAGPFMAWMKHFRSHLGTVEKTMGALLVVTGVLFMTGQITVFSFWLLSLFPSMAQIG